MTIDRRTLLATGAAGVALSGLPRAALAQQAATGVTYLPPSYEALTFGSSGFVDYLAENHAEDVAVEFYDSGRLLSADEQLPALRQGTIDFMFHTTSYITRSLPVLGILGLPGVAGELYENPDRLRIGTPLFQLIDEQLRTKGVTALSLGGGIMEPEFIWSTDNAPVRTLDDIEGKRVRVVSFEATKAIEDLGGAAVRIPSSELYLALQRGTVDAAVANIATINGRSIQEQVTQVLELPVTAYAIGIFVQTDRWERAPEAYREAMMDAARWFDENSARTANQDYFEQQYWPKFEDVGIERIKPDEAMSERFREISEQIRTAWTDEVGEDIGQRAIDLALGQGQG